MAIRRTLAEFSDDIASADIADNAVTTAKIADSQITAAKVAADVATQAELNVVSTAVDNVDTSTAMKPHIRTGVLQPAVAGKLLDGSTSHSGAYGTAQSDTFKYYYTDIKGSKPIKDPRIGSHFGSQRHTFRSIQKLEQETATHGVDVASVDGREWIRTSGKIGDSSNPVHSRNGSHGVSIMLYRNATSYFEITGYFSDANWNQYTGANRGFTYSLDGVADGSNYGVAVVTTPLRSRYVATGSSVNMGLGATLGIHTLKVSCNTSDDLLSYGIELIAQDTTSTATKSKIQIPSQNVVSYGKKFTVAAAAHHYDPFNGFTNSTTLHSAVVDTATSLGLSSAPGSSASWAISGSNNIRPYNGGRVVKWVDSSGVIKTSVNMMPPNAQNISGGVAGTTEVTTPSATNATYTPIFSDDAIDHSQAEVAKTFNWREFGNGAANTGGGGSYADASMLNAADGIAYVMDDGLTSMSAADALQAQGSLSWNSSVDAYITFIGTGISVRGQSSSTNDEWFNLAQNLPYGTHILKRASSDYVIIDGVSFSQSSASAYAYWKEVTFHQPKMPPIPEDAVVIADYMLMADFVAKTTEGIQYSSKGVRRCAASADVFYDGANAWTLQMASSVIGLYNTSTSSSTQLSRVTSFSTNCVKNLYGATARYQSWYTNDTGHSSADTTTKVGATDGSFYYPTALSVLGNNIYDNYGVSVTGAIHTHSYEFVSPIHTSSHYQTFETRFLHELVGGDRNMEQTNLVVTPDGKTWDEVTRDVSYLGKICVITTWDTGSDSASTFHIPTEWRGKDGSGSPNYYMNKDFAIAYDRVICLVSGEYHIMANAFENDAGAQVIIYVNGSEVQSHASTPASQSGHNTTSVQLDRGDYVQIKGRSLHFKEYNRFIITRV